MSRALRSWILVVGLAGGYPLAAAEVKLPVVDGREAVASVNGEPITLDDVFAEIAAVHAGRGETANVAMRRTPSELLDRLISVRLAVQEAKNVGFDELPEIRKAVEAFERDQLRNVLLSRQTSSANRGDPPEIDRIYKALVRQYRVRSVLVEKETDARELERRVKAGEALASAAREWVAAGKAKGGGEPQDLKASDLSPEIAKALRGLKPGQTSGLVKLGTNFTLIELLEIRYPESAEARAEAEKEALRLKRVAIVKDYTERLRGQHAKVDESLWKSLDFEAPQPGFKKLLQDQRPVCTISGEAPLTVGDLAAALEAKFFHGIDDAIAKKRVNKAKDAVLEDQIQRRVIIREAKRVGIPQDLAFRDSVRDYEHSLLFGAFVQKVIDPGLAVSDAEMRAHLDQRRSEYTEPETARIDALGFVKREAAEDAVAKLRKGADFRWMKANAEGQVDPRSDRVLSALPPVAAPIETFPEGLRKSIAGATAGEYRFFGDGSGPFYALRIQERTPARTRPLEAVRDQVRNRVLVEKRQRGLEEYLAKLRAASDVKIFADGDALSGALQRQAARGR